MMNITIERKHLPLVGIISAAVLTASAAAVALFSTNQPAQLAATPKIDCDLEWLTSGTSDIAYSAEQIRLYLDNRDASLCGGKSMIKAQTSIMAQMYLASATQYTADPKHPCHRGTVEQCLASFSVNIGRELKASQKPQEKIALLMKAYALTEAVEAYMTNKPLNKVVGGDVNLAVVLLENLRLDIQRSVSQSDEGRAKEIRQERQEQKQTDADLDGQYIPLK